MKKRLITLLSALACAGAQAEFFDGNKLLARIKGDQHVLYVLKKAWPCAKKGSGV